MSDPSSWPLSQEALRIRLPQYLTDELRTNSVSKDCFPTAVGYYPHARNHKMDRQGHDDFILIYCANGRGSLKYEGKRIEIEKGEVFILPPTIAHEYESGSCEPWTIFWCHFSGDNAQEYYKNVYKFAGSVAIGLASLKAQSLLEELVFLLSGSHTLATGIHASSVLRYLLTFVERQVNHTLDKGDNRLFEVQRYMRSHLNEQLTLNELAKLSGLSKYHFSRRYKELTGYTPLQHFDHFKLEYACFLLEFTELKVASISYKIGVEDALYFSRKFKKEYGISPSEYRKSLIVNR